MISIDDFKKIELKVGTIREVKAHPEADRLYVLKVDFGQEVRQLVAGIRAHYCEDSLLGKQVVVVTNLAPAVIRGIESQGMILASQDEAGISVLTPDRYMKEGSGIR